MERRWFLFTGLFLRGSIIKVLLLRLRLRRLIHTLRSLRLLRLRLRRTILLLIVGLLPLERIDRHGLGSALVALLNKGLLSTGLRLTVTGLRLLRLLVNLLTVLRRLRLLRLSIRLLRLLRIGLLRIRLLRRLIIILSRIAVALCPFKSLVHPLFSGFYYCFSESFKSVSETRACFFPGILHTV